MNRDAAVAHQLREVYQAPTVEEGHRRLTAVRARALSYQVVGPARRPALAPRAVAEGDSVGLASGFAR